MNSIRYAAEQLAEDLDRARASIGNTRTMGYLIRMFGEYDRRNDFWASPKCQILVAVAQHPQLLGVFAGASGFEWHYDLTKAIQPAKEGHFLIYFADLQLYATTRSIKNLEMLMLNVRSVVDEVNESNTVAFAPIIKQIVIAESRQKLIFICDDGPNQENLIKQLQDCIKLRLGFDSTVEKTGECVEVSVDKLLDNYQQTEQKFKDLRAQMREKNNLVADAIWMPEIRRSIIGDYTSPDISSAINLANMGELIKFMKAFPSGFTLGTLNVNIINNNSTGTANINNMVAYDPYNVATTWIKNNLPDDREITTTYYDRYRMAVTQPYVLINIFGKLVRAEGYETLQSTKCRLWVKSDKQ